MLNPVRRSRREDIQEGFKVLQTSEVTQDKRKKKKMGSPTKAVLRGRVRKGGAAERQGNPRKACVTEAERGYAEEEGSVRTSAGKEARMRTEGLGVRCQTRWEQTASTRG